MVILVPIMRFVWSFHSGRQVGLHLRKNLRLSIVKAQFIRLVGENYRNDLVYRGTENPDLVCFEITLY